MAEEARNLYDRWPKLEQEEKRDIVEQITQNIYISNDEIKIKFHYTALLSKVPTESNATSGVHC